MISTNKIHANSWFIIANPTSGNRNFSKKWKEIQLNLKKQDIEYTSVFTQYTKHEIKLVQNAIQKGFRNIISVGGDGTLHHVVNGIMLQRYVKTSNITIGVIPLGTGNDWIKHYNMPNSIKKSIHIIFQKKRVLQDIGLIKTLNNTPTYFNNVAGIGFDAYVVSTLKKLKKLGKLSYTIAGIYGNIFYKKPILKIIIDDKEITEKSLLTIFGICKYSGGGMQFTEQVDAADGLLDITVAKNLNFFDVVKSIHKLYNGTIVHHKKVQTYKTKEITIVPKTLKPFVQADGELIGTGTIKVSIIQRAIQFCIPYFF